PLRRAFGLSHGFDHYDDDLALEASGDWADRSAPETTARAISWIATQPGPIFAWIHYFDAHDPYEPPAHLLQPGAFGAYLGEVAAIDHAVGSLFAALDRLRGDRPRLVVVTADHGESLGEHGEDTHGF